jgi:hypothetical protein
MKLKIEINMDNDAMLNDPIGEVMRMIKLGIRQTELQKDCTLYDINGQAVGKLEIIDEPVFLNVTKNDFKKGQEVTITAILNGKETKLENYVVMELMDSWMLVEKGDEGFLVRYNRITQL